MKAKTVAEQVVQLMLRAGIRRVYGVVGDALNPLCDAIRRDEKIRWISTKHEETGAFAAGADALISGSPVACAGTCGPGALHLINGLYDAHRNNSTVFALAGQVPSKFIGTDYFQEIHPEALFRECTSYCQVAYTPAQALAMTREGIQSSITERDVGLVSIPGDILAAEAPGPLSDQPFHGGPPRVRPCRSDLDSLTAMLQASERPVIFGGEGCRAARDQVLALAERLQAPVGFTFRAKDILEADNPRAVGMTGLLGWGGMQQALEKTDLLILLGTDFPYSDFLPSVKTVQLDHRPAHLGRRTPLALGVAGDVAETLDELLPRLRPRTDRKFLDQALSAHAAAAERMRTHVVHPGKEGAIRPELVADAVGRLAAPDAIFTADTGMSCVWAARYLRLKPAQRFLASFGHGTMANAMPQAIGAQLAAPDREVVALCGDGGLSMLLGDLLTVLRHNLPLKLIVFNNSSLGMVRAEMLVAGYPFFETESPAVSFAAIAGAMGMPTERVERPRDVESALARVFEHSGPALLDVTTDPNALAMPPKTTWAELGGFALAMTRMVFDGGLDEAIDLAQVNARDLPSALKS